jgi:hypothetical protein
VGHFAPPFAFKCRANAIRISADTLRPFFAAMAASRFFSASGISNPIIGGFVFFIFIFLSARDTHGRGWISVYADSFRAGSKFSLDALPECVDLGNHRLAFRPVLALGAGADFLNCGIHSIRLHCAPVLAIREACGEGVPVTWSDIHYVLFHFHFILLSARVSAHGRAAQTLRRIIVRSANALGLAW